MAKRSRPRSISWRQLAWALACAILVSYLVAFVEVRLQSSFTRKRVREFERQNAALEEEQKQLQDELRYVRSDAYVEKVAREELKWHRPGEGAFSAVPAKEAEPVQQPESPAVPSGKPPLWQQLKERLLGPDEPAERNP